MLIKMAYGFDLICNSIFRNTGICPAKICPQRAHFPLNFRFAKSGSALFTRKKLLYKIFLSSARQFQPRNIFPQKFRKFEFNFELRRTNAAETE